MSTDHPGRPFRYGIRFKIAVSIGVIMVALMAVDILWNLSLQNAQAENEALEKAEVLAAEMRAAWDFVDMNQEVINRAEDGTFRTKHLVCVVAAKSISMLFTTETDYSIRFTLPTRRTPSSRRPWPPSTPTPTARHSGASWTPATARGCSAIRSRCT